MPPSRSPVASASLPTEAYSSSAEKVSSSVPRGRTGRAASVAPAARIAPTPPFMSIAPRP